MDFALTSFKVLNNSILFSSELLIQSFWKRRLKKILQIPFFLFSNIFRSFKRIDSFSDSSM